MDRFIGARIVLFTGWAAVFSGCAENPASGREAESPSRATVYSSGSSTNSDVNPFDGISAYEAELLATPYEASQPLAPFSVSEADFFNNPEIVSDQQFMDQGELFVTDDEVPLIEVDQSYIESYTTACTSPNTSPDGKEEILPADGSLLSAVGVGPCETAYNNCVKRCRRLRFPRARALCYAACMASYARCRGGR